MNNNFFDPLINFIIVDDDEIVIELRIERLFKNSPTYKLVASASNGAE